MSVDLQETGKPRRPAAWLLEVLGFATIYYATARLGLLAEMRDPVLSLSPIGPAAGLAIGVMLWRGYRVWAGIALGAFLIHYTQETPMLAALGATAANTLEPLFATFLMTLAVGSRPPFGRSIDLFRFIVLACVVATAGAAMVGVAGLCSAGASDWTDYWSHVLSWWLGDSEGALIVAPAILAWADRSALPRSRRRIPEAILVSALLGLVGWVVFGWGVTAGSAFPLAFLPFPIIVLATYRFGLRGATAATLATTTMAILGTDLGYGPFARESSREVYVLLLSFQAVLAIMGLALAVILTERKQAEDSLRESQARLSSVINTAIDPIIGIDLKGKILMANPAVETVFGWKVAELLGKNVAILMAEPYRGQHQESLRSYEQTRSKKAVGSVLKVMGKRRDGKIVPVEISVSELGEESDISFVGIIRDVTEREQMVAKLAETERLAAIGGLAAGVAHEVNNPVNTIINCAQLLADGDRDESLPRDILYEGNRIAEIVQDLLDFAREKDEDFHAVSVADVVTRTVSLIRRSMERVGIELAIEIPEHVPAMRGRFQQIEQVLLNLLLNSRDALATADPTKEKRIQITAYEIPRGADELFVRVTVRDTGPGIPKKIINTIFQPFFTTKRGRGGTGLGLSVSQGIVESHGGRIQATSTEGESTEISFELPAASADQHPG